MQCPSRPPCLAIRTAARLKSTRLDGKLLSGNSSELYFTRKKHLFFFFSFWMNYPSKWSKDISPYHSTLNCSSIMRTSSIQKGEIFVFFRTETKHSPIPDRDQKTLSVGNLDVTRRGFRACALDRLIERKGERERRFIILCNHFPIFFFCASFHATEPTKRKGTKEKLISGSTVAYVASDNASKKC